LARAKLAVVESLRPRSTLHEGPPSCTAHIVYRIKDKLAGDRIRVILVSRPAGGVSYRDDGVSGGDGKDVGAGDDPRAHGLHLRLDVVDDAEASDGPDVRVSGLLAGEGGRVVQQHRRIAALRVVVHACGASTKVFYFIWTPH